MNECRMSINRREFIRLTTATLAGGLLPLKYAKSASGHKKPNIVIILADDMGYSDIGCYGCEIETPNLDNLAADGLRFTQFYNAARCCPTRASLLTGLYPHQAGLGHMVYNDHGPENPGYRTKLNNRCVTLAEVLKQAGYHTMMTGKWHVGHQKGAYPTDRGFDRFYGIHIHVDSYWKVLPECPVFLNGEKFIAPTANPPNTLHPEQQWYTTNVFTDYALKFLKEASQKESPFLLYLAYNSPHWPLEAPEKDIRKYRGKYKQGWENVRKKRFQRMKKMGISKQNWTLSPSEAPDWESISENDRKNLDFRRAIYAAQIDNMDQNIGRVIKQLKKQGDYKDTLILFLSDNGCSAEPENKHFGYSFEKNRIENFNQWRKMSGRSSSQGLAWANASDTPFRKYKKWTHEGGIATPLIAHWPAGISNPGTLNHTPGHIIDIMATCMDLSGAKYPRRFSGNNIHPREGVSLAPAFQGKTIHGSSPLFWEHEGNWAIRDGKWKLVCDGPEGPLELYDMQEDRTEVNDLSEKYPQKVEQMQNKWKKWAKHAYVLPWPW